MNIKKHLSIFAAAAVFVASTASMAVNAAAAPASSTLTRLKTIEAKAEISGYTEDGLKSFSLKALLESMTYAEDEPAVGGQALAAEMDNGLAAENGEFDEEENASNEEEAASDGEEDASNDEETASDGEEAASNDEETDIDENNELKETSISSNALSAGETSTVSDTGYKAGDKVVFPAGAKYVWVGNNEYSISDGDAVIDLTSSSSSDSYTLNRDIIVGSGKQLDPSNVLYRVTIKVNASSVGYELKLYPIVNGVADKTNAIECTQDYTSDSYINFKSDSQLKADTKYEADLVCSIDGYAADDISAEINYKGYDKTNPKIISVDASGSGYIYTDIKITKKSDNSVLLDKRNIRLYIPSNNISIYASLYDSSNSSVSNSSRISSKNGTNSFSEKLQALLKPGKNAKDVKSLYISLSSEGSPTIAKAVAGNYDTLKAAESAASIGSGGSSIRYTLTAKDDLKTGIDFTIFVDPTSVPALIQGENVEAYVCHLNISAEDGIEIDEETVPDDIKYDFQNAYFRLNAVKDASGTAINSLILDSNYDTYYKMHRQTALLYDGSADLSQLKLNVSWPQNVTLAVSDTGGPINDINDTVQNFSGGAIKYTVAAPAGQGVYTVDIAKSGQGGLFVAGSDERKIFFDDFYGEYHDVLLANLGTSDITGLKVELIDPQNIVLDDFWRLDGEANNSTLKPFGTEANSTEGLAKIRLKPMLDENGIPKSGEIGGKLRITVNGTAVRTIELTGSVSNLEIITNAALPEAVKYVPYSAVISTDNVHEFVKVSFELYSGKLPEGLTFDKRSGEIYGTPQKAGKYSFGIRARFDYKNMSPNGTANDANDYSDKYFTLNISDNTDTNVFNATDTGYDILDFVGTEATVTTVTGSAVKRVLSPDEAKEEQPFRSNGVFAEFIDFWLDGEKLVKGADYDAAEGSTKITIKSQTLEKLAPNEDHTIAIEFRVDGDLKKELKRTAQNFIIKEASSDNNTSGGDSNVPVIKPTPSVPDNNSGNDNNITANPNDIVFTPVVNGEINDPQIKDIISNIKVTAPAGVLPENAVLNVKLDLSVTDDKGLALDFTFTLNGAEIQPDGTVTVYVDIPDYYLNKTLYVYHIENGKYIFVDSAIRDNKIIFKASHFSTYVISDKKLDADGNVITGGESEDGGNPNTGIAMSAAAMAASGSSLAAMLASRRTEKAKRRSKK